MRLAAILTIAGALLVGAPDGSAAPREEALGLTPASFPDGAVGKPYRVSVLAVGGVGNTALITCGNAGFDRLPKGVDQNVKGPKELVVAGTPTQAGKFEIDVCATDSTGVTFRRVYTFTIAGNDTDEKPKVTIGVTSPDDVEEGELVRFNVLVGNTGSTRAENVRVRVEGTHIDAIGPDHGRCDERTATRYDCNLGTLAAKAKTKIGVVVKAGKSGSQLSVLGELLSETSFHARKVEAFATVIEVADLDVSLDGEAPTGPGKPVIWTIVVHNKGPGTAAGRVKGDAPKGVVFRRAAAKKAVCSVFGGEKFDCGFRELGDGEKLSITLSGRPLEAERTVVNEVEVVPSKGVRDPLKVNNHARATTRTR